MFNKSEFQLSQILHFLTNFNDAYMSAPPSFSSFPDLPSPRRAEPHPASKHREKRDRSRDRRHRDKDERRRLEREEALQLVRGEKASKRQKLDVGGRTGSPRRGEVDDGVPWYEEGKGRVRPGYEEPFDPVSRNVNG